MYGNRTDGNWYDDIDIDGRDSNGNMVDRGGYIRDDYVYDEEPEALYSFSSLEDLISSKIFQEQLSKALSFKDKQILALQQEIIKLINNRTLT